MPADFAPSNLSGVNMTSEHLQRLSRARDLIHGEGRARRQSAQLTMREVADTLGIDVAALHRWETGATSPRGSLAIEWLDLLESVENARCDAQGN